jgi:hypothetical protein
MLVIHVYHCIKGILKKIAMKISVCYPVVSICKVLTMRSFLCSENIVFKIIRRSTLIKIRRF